ncbi:12212_t:CDS:2 [Ambispora gerdemannii]|uniref:12212_t:CDS:1 n=1 Tax=Ambispora gerdemannii TaxID=144530 RepID=A0A9N8ZRS0_9GLOM|nr:12212_t:CDS:2 [Ambispora gerdemannii]
MPIIQNVTIQPLKNNDTLKNDTLIIQNTTLVQNVTSVQSFAKPDAAKGLPGNGKYKGDGTWYKMTDNVQIAGQVSCNSKLYNHNNDYIVALNKPDYLKYAPEKQKNDAPTSLACGKKVRIYHMKDEKSQIKSVDATIVDLCPECKSGDLDLYQVVFNKLSDNSIGRISISWEFLDEEPPAKNSNASRQFYLANGSALLFTLTLSLYFGYV